MNLNGGDGKKRVTENIWIARTSGTVYVLVDNNDEGILYGELISCRSYLNNGYVFSYKDFDSEEVVTMILDAKGSKLGQTEALEGMIEVDKFYESLK